MPPPYRRPFRVRHYELDARGSVQSVTFVQYMQEAAIEASTALGCSPDWYRAHDLAWVVRKLWVRYFEKAVYGDEVEIATWISTMRGVRSNREYVLTRGRDAVPLARGRAEWIFFDTKEGQPTRCPDDWTASVVATEPEDLGVAVGTRAAAAGAHRSRSCRRVHFYDLDGGQHVNHAVYLRWIEEAAFDALQAVALDGILHLKGHEIQYLASALANDPIAVVGWLSESAGAELVWTSEVSNSATGKVLARDFSLWAVSEPTAAPDVIERLVRGPSA